MILSEKQMSGDAEKIAKQSDDLYAKLTADLSRDVSSVEIQDIVQEILDFVQEHATSVSLDYENVLIQAYSSDYVKTITDAKYGVGAADYIVKAFRWYSEN